MAFFLPRREHSDITNLIESYLFEITGREVLILPGLSQSMIETLILQRWSGFIELFEREDEECLNYLQKAEDMSVLFDMLLRVPLTKKQLEFYVQFLQYFIPSENQLLVIFSSSYYSTDDLQSVLTRIFEERHLHPVLANIHRNVNTDTVDILLFVNEMVIERCGMDYALVEDYLSILVEKSEVILDILRNYLQCSHGCCVELQEPTSYTDEWEERRAGKCIHPDYCLSAMRFSALLSEWAHILICYKDEDMSEEEENAMNLAIKNLYEFLEEHDILNLLGDELDSFLSYYETIS